MSFDILETTGTLVGLLYLWFEYRASIYVWVTGIVMPAIYICVYYNAGLYADCGINIYYVVAGAYGLYKWHRSREAGLDKSDTAARIIHTPVRLYPVLATVAALLIAGMGLALQHCTDSTVPWWDATTTALSVVALWMMAHRHAEQWLVWIVVDAVCCGLYVYKGLYLTGTLYAIYTIIAVAGYRKWCRLAAEG